MTALMVRIIGLLALFLDVMAMNEPNLLSYLLLRVIKTKALSLLIIALGWFNFKCQENRSISRPKKGVGVLCDYQAVLSKVHSQLIWKKKENLNMKKK